MIAITEKTTGHAGLSSPRQTPRGRVRVWLTDDNAIFRGLLQELLLRSGEFDCERQFESAESLLEALANEPSPDVILLDVEMGGMTGVEALRPIRTLAPGVRVLIVTSFFDPLYEAQAFRDGASTYLVKAYTPQNLVKEIYRALASPVQLTELVPPVKPMKSISEPTDLMITKRSLMTRLTAWLANLPTVSSGQLEIHRPAATQK